MFSSYTKYFGSGLATMEADPLPSNAVDIDAGNGWRCSENYKRKTKTEYLRKNFNGNFLFFEL